MFAKKEWLAGLKPFDDDTLQQAIIQCRDTHEMPPTLPQVIGICRGIQRRNHFYVAEQNFVPAKKEIMQHHLAKCKAALGNQRFKS